MRMIDVSSYNAEITDYAAYIAWSKENGQESGIIIRVSEGTGFYDATWQQRSREALAAGIDEIYYYCYSHPEFNSIPASEVNYIWQAVKSVIRQGKDTLMLDMEQRVSRATPAYALAWLNQASKLVEKLPVFYSYLNYIETMGYASCPSISTYPLALADYTNVVPSPPAPWADIFWWQNSDKGNVPGINGLVDTDIIEDTIMAPSQYYTVTFGKEVSGIGIHDLAQAYGFSFADFCSLVPGNAVFTGYDNNPASVNGMEVNLPGIKIASQSIDVASIRADLQSALSKLG